MCASGNLSANIGTCEASKYRQQTCFVLYVMFTIANVIDL